MKLIIYIILIVVSLLFLANTSIQFKPFKVTFETPFLAIGVLFMMIGMCFIMVQPQATAYQKGLDKGGEIMKEAAIQAAEQIIKESKAK